MIRDARYERGRARASDGRGRLEVGRRLTDPVNGTSLLPVLARLGFASVVWIAGIAASLFGGVACGSASVGEGTGGSGATGGSAASGGTGATGGSSGTQGLGGAGGTGGGVQNPPPAAGLTVALTQPSVTEVPGLGARTCNVPEAGHVYTIGTPAPGGTVPDGTDDVHVSCAIGLNVDGMTMNVYADVSGADTTTVVPIALEVESPSIKSRDPAPAAVSFDAPENGHLVPLDPDSDFPPCLLGPFATLKDGAMLADFTCPLLGSPDDDTIGCRAHGTLGVEYCETTN